MPRWSLIAIICLAFVCQGRAKNGNDNGLFGGQLADKPILKALLMKNLFGGEGNNPILKAMFMKKLSEKSDGEDGGLFGGELADKPLLKALIMKNLFGGQSEDEGIPKPLLLAMLSGNTPPPIVRAMIARRVMQNNQERGNIIPKLLIAKHIAMKLGNRILAELKERRDSKHVYTFIVSAESNTALEYADAEGNMKGFSEDIIDAVCEAAGKKCVVQFDPSDRCITHDGRHYMAGEGLLGKEYDACLTWFKTKDRTHSVAFTEPYWKIDNVYNLYVKEGNPGGFDPTNLSGKTLGFINGWSGGHACLAHVDGHADMTYKYVANKRALFTDLSLGKFDAAFLIAGYFGPQEGFETVGESFKCSEPGITHAITRKDSRMIEWFDKTLKEMKKDGRYHGLCNKARSKHGDRGSINCITEDDVVEGYGQISCGENCWL